MFRTPTLALTLSATILTLAASVPSLAQQSDNRHVDIHSSVGDLHVGEDADARKVGVPLYPGARLKSNGDNNNQANLSLLTEAFGMKLVVANYLSDDDPAKVLAFYRDKLKRFGKVIECHTDKHGVDVHDDDSDNDNDSRPNTPLTCGKNTGPVIELKAGTEQDQHVVAVEQGDSGKGSKFALVYVHTRGKQADI